MNVIHLTNGYPSKKYPTYCIFIKEQIDSLVRIHIKNSVFVINPYKKGLKGYFIGFIKLIWFTRTKKFKNANIIHCHHVISFLLYFLCFVKKKNVVLSFLNDRNVELSNLGFPGALTHFVNYLIDIKVKLIIYKNSFTTRLNSNNYYLPNGVDIDFFEPIDKRIAKQKLGLHQKLKYILFVSSVNIRDQKRYDIYSEVVKILKTKDNSISELVLINEPRQKIPYYFNASELHLLTSDYEGSPNSVKEAMSCNLPVVSTNVGNVSILFEGTTNCFFSKSNNINELVELCRKAFLSENRNSRNKIKSLHLDMNSVAKKLQKIYNLALD